jgi:hypothetical protein
MQGGSTVVTTYHTGLDHLEFLVAERSDLDEWAERLDTLGVPHSGSKELAYTNNAMITVRDPGRRRGGPEENLPLVSLTTQCDFGRSPVSVS